MKFNGVHKRFRYFILRMRHRFWHWIYRIGYVKVERVTYEIENLVTRRRP